jgi:Zn finger protein HypA/HybF involved in hydrogenase expression
MHESGLFKNIINKACQVARDQGAESITAITVRLGAFSMFTKEHFLEHFVYESNGTPLAGIKVNLILDQDERSPNAKSVILEAIEVQ